MTFDIDTIETGVQSVTAAVCENAQLYGAAPERDEFDSRDVWDRDDAMAAVSEAFRIIAQGVGPDGFQLADERESLLWGFVNTLDAQTQRLDRAADKLIPGMQGTAARAGRHRRSDRANSNSTTDRAQQPHGTPRRLRAASATRPPQRPTAPRPASLWRPRRGSHVVADRQAHLRRRSRRATSKGAPARIAANTAHLPQGTLVAVAGGKDIAEPMRRKIIAHLDKVKRQVRRRRSRPRRRPRCRRR